MKWRRLKAGIGSPHPCSRFHPQPTTERAGLVLGATLNRSESRCRACPRELSRLIALDELRIVLALAAPDLNQHRRLEVQPALVVVLDAIPYLRGASLESAHFRVSRRLRCCCTST
jgi:hypothetical protein